MIDNLHLLELDKEELAQLIQASSVPIVQYKLKLIIQAADPVTVVVLAIQQLTAMITPEQKIHDAILGLFIPFVKGRKLHVTALPYNKDPFHVIDYNNSKDLLNALWLFLTNDTMPDKAMISREAFNHEVGVIIELLKSKY